jgi:hypothetical protein
MEELIPDHERLDVYRLSLDEAAFSYPIAKSHSGDYLPARNQWLRAVR